MELIPLSFTGMPEWMMIPVLICYFLIAVIKLSKDKDGNVG